MPEYHRGGGVVIPLYQEEHVKCLTLPVLALITQLRWYLPCFPIAKGLLSLFQTPFNKEQVTKCSLHARGTESASVSACIQVTSVTQ